MFTNRRNYIEEVLKDCLKQIAGDKCPADFNPDDDVMNRCGLDSLHGVELSFDLAERLDLEIPLTDNPLVGDGEDCSRRSRSYAEVVNYLAELSAAGKPDLVS